MTKLYGNLLLFIILTLPIAYALSPSPIVFCCHDFLNYNNSVSRSCEEIAKEDGIEFNMEYCKNVTENFKIISDDTYDKEKNQQKYHLLGFLLTDILIFSIIAFVVWYLHKRFKK